MGKRLSKSARELALGFLLQRDGSVCQGCKKGLDRGERIDVDHIDGNPGNNDANNLRLMHHMCNVVAYRQRVKEALNLQSGVVQERERIPRPPRPEDGFAPNKNYIVEPIFRKWLFIVLLAATREGRKLRKEDIVRDGSAYCGASMQSVYNYLARMTAPTFGPFWLTRDATGEVTVQFKHADDIQLLVDELETKYPYEGVRTKEV